MDSEAQKFYVSDRQRRWAHTPDGRAALGSALSRWDNETRGKKLPEKVKEGKPVRYPGRVRTVRKDELSLSELMADLVAKHHPHNTGTSQAAHGREGPKRLTQATLVNGGLTYNRNTDSHPTTGFAVSPYPERSLAVHESKLTPDVMASWLRKNEDLLRKKEHNVGTWKDDDGTVYVDISVVTSQTKAIQLARKHDQIAIWDIAGAREIVVDRNAKSGQG